MERKTIGMISLGCDKNRVDSEKMLGFLSDEFDISNDMQSVQILIINTCSFLGAARKEAIETVFNYLPYKEEGRLEKIIMTGCLPQKFIGEFFEELVEVDGFLGTYDASLLKRLISDIYNGERVNYVGQGQVLGRKRYLTTPPHYAYLKIADGCDNHCTYCLIPKIRGRFISEPIESLVEEAKELGDVGELILVAQDTTKYGKDIYGKPSLIRLIRALSALENISSIRLLYCYPELVDDALIEEIATNKKVVKYLDMPLQHASDRVLKLMGRKGNNKTYLELISKLKERVEGIAIRSTFMTGFPGETEEDVEILADFLKQARLFNSGFFAYSKEKDTPSYKLPNHLRADVKKKRLRYLYSVQNAVMGEILDGFIGKQIEVVADGITPDFSRFVGRAYFSAPEIDGNVILTGDFLVEQGQKYLVTIKRRKGCDLYGVIEDELT